MNWHATPGPQFSLVQTRLWLVAVVFFVIGDLVTTGVGLTAPGLTEGSPFGAALIHHRGFAGAVGVKLTLLFGFLLLWRWLPRPHCVGIPLGLAVAGVVATGWNLAVLTVAFLL